LQFAPGSAVAPPGLTLSSAGEITWDLLNADNPSVAPGQYYTMTAMLESHDSTTGAFVSEAPVDFLLEVVAAPQPLVFDTLPPLTNTVVYGAPQDFVLHASESDASQVLIDYDPLPPGMTVTQPDAGGLDVHFDPTPAEIGQTFDV